MVYISSASKLYQATEGSEMLIVAIICGTTQPVIAKGHYCKNAIKEETYAVIDDKSTKQSNAGTKYR